MCSKTLRARVYFTLVEFGVTRKTGKCYNTHIIGLAINFFISLFNHCNLHVHTPLELIEYLISRVNYAVNVSSQSTVEPKAAPGRAIHCKTFDDQTHYIDNRDLEYDSKNYNNIDSDSENARNNET